MTDNAFNVFGVQGRQRVHLEIPAPDAVTAEKIAREQYGVDLIAAVTEGHLLVVHNLSLPADLGPGSPDWEASQGALLTDSSIVPSVGDIVYVPFDEGGHPSLPDYSGGLARVASVEQKDDYVMVGTDIGSGTKYNWNYLSREQESLHKRYGTKRAQILD